MIGPVRFLMVAGVSTSVILNVGLLTFAYVHTHPANTQSTPPVNQKVPIKIGAAAPVIKATDLKGTQVTLDPTTQATILYIIRPSCGWCEKNTANIAAFSKQASDRYKFIGLSLDADGLEAYLKRFPLGFPTYVADKDTILAYGFTPTPSTVVIAEGKVQYKMNGAYEPKQVMEQRFRITLPGISGG